MATASVSSFLRAIAASFAGLEWDGMERKWRESVTLIGSIRAFQVRSVVVVAVRFTTLRSWTS